MPVPTFGQLSDTRRNNFDFLRFFFASLVIFSHSYMMLRPDGVDVDPLARVTGLKMSLGAVSVACFFAISGFLITQSWLRAPRLRDYVKKRALRIYPGWIVALLLGALVFAPLLRFPHRLDLGVLRTYLSFEQLLLKNFGFGQVVPGVDPTHTLFLNGSTWTIPYEITCYALVAVLGALGLLRRRAWVLALAAALLLYVNLPGLTLWATFGPTVPGFRLPYFGWLRCLPLLSVYFLSGVLFFLYRERVPHSPWLFGASLALVALALGHLPLAPLLFAVFPTFGLYALFYLAFLPLGRLHAWAKRGDLSYGVYLYAFPLQRLLISERFRGYHLSPLTLFVSAWVLSCGAAALSWRFVERPALRHKPKAPGPPAEDAGVPAASAA